MRQKGFSLLELLVSLALAASLSAAFTRLYLQSQKQQQHSLAVTEVYENAQLAMDILQYELRMAGFSKGAQVQAYSGRNCPDEKAWLLDFTTGIDTQANTAFSVFGVPMNTSCLKIAFVEGSDVLWIRRLASQAIQSEDAFYEAWYWLEKHHQADSQFAYLDTWPTAAQLATIKQLWPVHSRIYYVRSYSVKGDNTPSLVVVKPTPTGFKHQVLIEGVESLQLQWQVKDNQHWQLHRPPSKAQLQQAVLARIYLLVRNRRPLQGINSDADYVLADSKAIDVDDRRYYRQLFMQSVMLRNHGVDDG